MKTKNPVIVEVALVKDAYEVRYRDGGKLLGHIKSVFGPYPWNGPVIVSMFDWDMYHICNSLELAMRWLAKNE